jgi:hypothetical protein
MGDRSSVSQVVGTPRPLVPTASLLGQRRSMTDRASGLLAERSVPVRPAAEVRREAGEGQRAFKYIATESMPARVVKSALGAVTLPRDVYQGKVDPNSQEAIERSADLAGLVTVGSGAIPAAKGELRMGIKAYHGSPHDFDKFDRSKIGTGEGNQTEGYGFYFSKSDAAAEQYKDPKNPIDFGRLYKVELDAKKDELLHLDDLMSEQPKQVQDFFAAKIDRDQSGYEALEALEKKYGPKKAAEMLRDAGIKGTRYADESSSGVGDSAVWNYVIFDERNIKILEKYGVAGLLAASAAMAGGTKDAQAKDTAALRKYLDNLDTVRRAAK